MTTGEQFEWVVKEIRESIPNGYMSIEFINKLCGPAIGAAAIAYLKVQKEVQGPYDDGFIGKI